jgi:hypothetical protein
MPDKADPSIYPKMRATALEIRLNGVEPKTVHTVLMDWNVANGTATVMAAADGSASIYLSGGGGYLGGGQKYPAIKLAAQCAVSIATNLLDLFKKVETCDLPNGTTVSFFATTDEGVFRATGAGAELQKGSDSLAALGAAMQLIVTFYRTMVAPSPSSHT